MLSLAEVQLELHQFKEASASWDQAELLADNLGGGAPARLFLACSSHLEPTRRRALLEKARKRLLELAPLLPERDRPYFFQQPAVRAVLQDQPLSPDPAATPQEALTREQFVQLTNQLRQRLPGLEEQLAAPIPAILEVQPRLKESEVFLCFTSLPHQVIVLGCTRGDFFARSLFFEQARLIEQIEELRRATGRPGGHFQPSARRLYNNLLRPLEHWTESRHVWLAQQGALFNLPWNALQDEHGRFVVERWRSLRLWWGLSNAIGQPPRLRQALLVAAPGKKQLEGVIPEVQEIAHRLPSSQILTGPQATRASLKRCLPATGWLHLAAHSKLDRASLNNSYVELSDGPLLLSQLYSLKLAPQTTVVLSSCQTALGQSRPGKDVISLGSGFRISGAGQVVATLWPVDDQASLGFFRKFYQALRNGCTVAESLTVSARAQLKTPAWRHPFYWAPYQLKGEMFR